VSENSPGNPCSQSRRRKERLQWEGLAKKEGFKSGIKERGGGGRDEGNGEHMDDGTDGRTVPLIRLGESELWRD